MKRTLRVVFLLSLTPALFFSACAVPGYNAPTTPTPTPSPTPKPPKQPPEKPPVWECKITNNEGRIFVAVDSEKWIAEGNARRACSINYRHCTYLDCNLIKSED